MSPHIATPRTAACARLPAWLRAITTWLVVRRGRGMMAGKETVVKHYLSRAAIGAIWIALGCACSTRSATFTRDAAADAEPDAAVTPNTVDPLVILSRPARNDSGDIFQYTSYVPGARLIRLPPSLDGTPQTPTTICCDQAGPEYAHLDISSYDLAFDARSIVFSAKLAAGQTYGLFVLQLADGSVTQLATDPQRDYVSPIFLPGGRVMFTTNAGVEPGAPQFRDEYERGVATQLGRINLDGTDLELAPRNLSHRTAPSLGSDGRVVFTQWDHLGPENGGHLMFVDQDMTGLHEGFGKEGSGVSSSTIKAREISPGRFIAIATARDRTLGAGAVIDIRLGDVETQGGVVSAAHNQAEARATSRVLTPDVPLDNSPSATTVGRYYDAFPLDAGDRPELVVSWADGPVEAGTLAAGGARANFGIYFYDSQLQRRSLIFDDPAMWDIRAMPLRPRPEPPPTGSQRDIGIGNQTLIVSLDVYQSTLHTFRPGEIFGVRVMEGFSSEEGFPESFGTTGFEGHANLGVAPVQPDHSWSAKIPANIPVHVQSVDVFGMSLFNEPVWFSGRAGEPAICGGCHEDRTRPPVISPGLLGTLTTGAVTLLGTTPRAQRLNTAPASATQIVGVGWTTQVQPILDAHCVTCHGDDNKAGIAGYTIVNPVTGASISWTLNLTSSPLPATLAVAAGGGAYSKSYFSMAGPDLEAVETAHLMIVGNLRVYLNPEDARGSAAIKLLNPTQLFPAPSATRAFPATTPHLIAKGLPDLTPQEHYTLILAADMGVSFFARENNPHTN